MEKILYPNHPVRCIITVPGECSYYYISNYTWVYIQLYEWIFCI